MESGEQEREGGSSLGSTLGHRDQVSGGSGFVRTRSQHEYLSPTDLRTSASVDPPPSVPTFGSDVRRHPLSTPSHTVTDLSPSQGRCHCPCHCHTRTLPSSDAKNLSVGGYPRTFCLGSMAGTEKIESTDTTPVLRHKNTSTEVQTDTNPRYPEWSTGGGKISVRVVGVGTGRRSRVGSVKAP